MNWKFQMNKFLYFIFKAAIFISLVIAIIEIYPRIKKDFDSDNDRPLFSLYEIIGQEYLDLSKPRDVSLRAFLSDRKRLYISQEDAKYGFESASFPIEFENSMEGCLNSYITLRATVMYEVESNQALFSNFEFMDIVRPVEFYKKLKMPPSIPQNGIHCD